MKAAERKRRIVDLVQSSIEITVAELIEILNVSEATIRRDLAKLESERVLVRYHGGARIIHDDQFEESMQLKAYQNTEEKTVIAIVASRKIQDNTVVYIDAGTTTFRMIDFIRAKNITVVTPGILHANKLIEKNIKAFLLGGMIKDNTKVVTGKDTVKMIQGMNFDLAFIGTNGVHKFSAFTTPEESEADVKAAAIAQSEKVYILADSSKFNKSSFITFASFKDATILTNVKVDFDAPMVDIEYFKD